MVIGELTIIYCSRECFVYLKGYICSILIIVFQIVAIYVIKNNTSIKWLR